MPQFMDGFVEVQGLKKQSASLDRDAWDQLVAVQFKSEVPRGAQSIKYGGSGRCNFVQFRRKGSSSARVRHEAGNSGTASELHTLLGDSSGLKEFNVLFWPLPTRQLIERAPSFP
jgi:hypothetical protein